MPITGARRPSARNVALVFHALSDETRLAVVELLRGGEHCVCDLQAAVGAAQSRLSFHLKVLKDAGLVTDRKDGRWSYYSLNRERFAEASSALGVLAEAPVAGSRRVVLHALQRAPGSAASSGEARRPRVKGPVAGQRDGCC